MQQCMLLTNTARVTGSASRGSGVKREGDAAERARPQGRPCRLKVAEKAVCIAKEGRPKPGISDPGHADTVWKSKVMIIQLYQPSAFPLFPLHQFSGYMLCRSLTSALGACSCHARRSPTNVDLYQVPSTWPCKKSCTGTTVDPQAASELGCHLVHNLVDGMRALCDAGHEDSQHGIIVLLH